ncbi:hypothetical protein RclHR1_00440033 [Rhizophagus clarus]|uniref:Uncharacterized protein n=1 Tax=Rhizophagus clarus TaxID=94130 RepID=A0A2Z6SB05_9GLOM|nr:hypothetical protein RclHR1_00440033 [Rhizophagus clarus]GES93473.1 hypothetical protein GLOIN_2v1834544 [Rhizophagus clarus]
MYYFLLVGTEIIKEFLDTLPYSSEHSLTSNQFTQAEIRKLLKQYSSDNIFELDEDISVEICSLTRGPWAQRPHWLY